MKSFCGLLVFMLQFRFLQGEPARWPCCREVAQCTVAYVDGWSICYVRNKHGKNIEKLWPIFSAIFYMKCQRLKATVPSLQSIWIRPWRRQQFWRQLLTSRTNNKCLSYSLHITHTVSDLQLSFVRWHKRLDVCCCIYMCQPYCC